jgi:hypothetical protein
MTLKELKIELDQYGSAYLKYIRVNNEYRFLQHDSDITHKRMLKEGEKATSAGYLKLTYDYAEPCEWSSTLQLGPAPDDKENLTEFLEILKSAIIFADAIPNGPLVFHI